MNVLTICLIQAQAGGWTSTNDPNKCKRKLNKHKLPKQAQTRTSSQTSRTRQWGQAPAQTTPGEHEQRPTSVTRCQDRTRVGEREWRQGRNSHRWWQQQQGARGCTQTTGPASESMGNRPVGASAPKWDFLLSEYEQQPSHNIPPSYSFLNIAMYSNNNFYN